MNGAPQTQLDQLQARVVAFHRRARTWFRRPDRACRRRLRRWRGRRPRRAGRNAPSARRRGVPAGRRPGRRLAGADVARKSGDGAGGGRAQATFDAAVAGREPDATMVERATVRRFLGVAAPGPVRGTADRALAVEPTAHNRTVAQAENGHWYPDRHGVPATRASLDTFWLNSAWDIPQRRFMARLAGAVSVVGLAIAVAATSGDRQRLNQAPAPLGSTQLGGDRVDARNDAPPAAFPSLAPGRTCRAGCSGAPQRRCPERRTGRVGRGAALRVAGDGHTHARVGADAVRRSRQSRPINSHQRWSCTAGVMSCTARLASPRLICGDASVGAPRSPPWINRSVYR